MLRPAAFDVEPELARVVLEWLRNAGPDVVRAVHARFRSAPPPPPKIHDIGLGFEATADASFALGEKVVNPEKGKHR